jgi:RNase H-like domain found in reverse transcriptase
MYLSYGPKKLKDHSSHNVMHKSVHQFWQSPRWGSIHVIDTDASGKAIGAVLSQNQNGIERTRVIAFASKSSIKSERNYSVTQRVPVEEAYDTRGRSSPNWKGGHPIWMLLQILSDQGPEFESSSIRELCNWMQIDKLRTSPL